MRLGQYFGGYKPSPPDAVGTHELHAMPRMASALKAVQLPARVDNSALIPYVLDQGAQGSCVGHGVAEAIWGELCRTANPTSATPKQPSPFWVYWMGRALDGSIGDDAGTYVSSAFEQIQKFGFLANEQLPYRDDIISVDAARIPALERAAYDQRIVTGCARIMSAGQQRVIDIKMALAAGYLVVFGTMVDMAFEMLGPGDVWPGIYGTSQPLGGHCMCITGYEENHVDVLNSWDPDGATVDGA